MTQLVEAPGLGGRAEAVGPRLRGFFRGHPAAFGTILAAVMLVVNVALQPNFSPVQEFAAFAPVALAAMATASAVLGGGIDLSISPQMVFASLLLVGYLTPAGLGGYVAALILVVVGAAIGTINGLIVVGLRIPPMVATLASMFIITGLNLHLASKPFVLYGGWVLGLAGGYGPVPGGLIVIAVPLLLWFALNRGAYGRNVLAVGGGDATAYSAGIKVGLVRVLSYAIGGVLAAIGGLALTSLVSSVDPTTSGSYVIGAIAAVALGGVSLQGGRGGMLGALAGAAVIFFVQNLLAVFGISQVWLNLTFGGLLLFAVLMGAVIGASPRKRGRA